ncbi:MAG: arginine--tRNA ligase [Patescibacteria group bacterium]|nr:arginine--tRNA ligase [Patescibacteria group bacterium]
MRSIIKKALQDISENNSQVVVDVPLERFGDYSTNLALISAPRGTNPRTYAEGLVYKLKANQDLMNLIERVEIAGPGFINFFVKQETLLLELAKLVSQENRYLNQADRKGTVLIEYSSPNIAKRFSIGHLRSTIIGDALKKLYSALGYKVIGENHLGDWGTQFGMIIAQIVRHNLDPKDLSVEDLEKLYVEFNNEMKNDPSLRDIAKEWFKKLENKDPTARQIWQIVKEISLREFKRIYDMLGVNIENEHGESFYEEKMPEVISLVKKAGICQVGEGGAIIVPFDDMPPAMLVKSDGTTTYFTRDLAAFYYRIKTWNPSVLIYEVGSDQTLHFKQVFETVKKLGWSDGRELKHVAHGLIRFQHGKMSTRRGETIKLEEVLEESVQRSKLIIKNSETDKGLTEEEVKSLSYDVGIGAVKYFDLSHAPESDIIFDWNKIIVLEGNSGPYLQYTYARTQSILEKSNFSDLDIGTLDTTKLKSKILDNELSLLRHIIHFKEVLEDAATTYSPNLLCNYLYLLSQKYNSYYSSNKIIGSENEFFRVVLTKAVGILIKNGLSILGIKTPPKM